MYKKLAVLFVTLSFAFGVFAQKTQPVNIAEQNLRRHVEYLASEQLEGRKAGEPGGTAAAGYVANQFGQFKLKPGIKPANGKASFLQPFPYVAGVSVGESTFLRIVPSDAALEQKMESGVNYIPYANSINADIASTEIVFAGYGITTADKKWDDYAATDAAGKVVLIFDGVPEGGSPEQFRGFNLHAKANLAKNAGAKGLIVITKGDDLKADPLSRLAYEPTAGETAIPVVAIVRQHGAGLLGAKDGKELAEIEKWLAMKTNAPPAVRIMLAQPPKATVSMRVDLQKKMTETYNVIGILEGKDPVLKNEAIVIGAHYDHLGRGGRSSLAANSTDVHHGADDNASGTSAMLEIARQFAKEKNNKRTIIFMSFGAEEEGLLGSKFYVNNPVWPLDKTVAMLNLDMVGRLNANKLTVGGIGTANEMRGLVEAANSIAAVPSAGSNGGTAVTAAGKHFELVLNEEGFGPSDHSSFYGKQIPVLFFFTGTHADYHKPSDTAEKINYAGVAGIADYVSAIAKNIDVNTAKPTYKVAQTAPTGGRMAFNVSLGTIPAYGDGNDGLAIDGVREGSPAAKAELKAGDKIIKVAGKDVRNISDYMFLLGTLKAGEEYEIVIKRGTETLTKKIVPAPAARRP